MATIILLVLTALVLSGVSVDLVRRTFQEKLIDIPNDRSSHTQPTPRGGGLGFIFAFAVTSAIATFFGASLYLLVPVWLILVPLTIVGILDDIQGIPAAPRYLVQLIAASITVFCYGAFPQPWLNNLGLPGQVIATILTVIGFTAIVNFYNFMDGLDGLVGGCTAVQLGFLAIYFNLPIFWLLVAALLGFLYWNWSPAKIFMGDAGSTVLGASVAIALLNNSGQAVQAWSALAIVLPIIGDTIYTLIHRLIQKENIFLAHRSHIFQRLNQSGWSHSQVALTYMGITLVIAILIGAYGSIGAWCSLALTVALILVGETYLRLRNPSMAKSTDY